VDDDDRLRFRPVTVLRREREDVLVSGGLVAGERVCTAPPPIVTDGMAVRVESTVSSRTATSQP